MIGFRSDLPVRSHGSFADHSRSSCSHFSTNILLVQNQRTLNITRYHKISQVADTQLPTDCPVTVLPGLGIPGVIAAAAPEVPVLNHGILQILERPFGHLTGNAMENEPFIDGLPV